MSLSTLLVFPRAKAPSVNTDKWPWETLGLKLNLHCKAALQIIFSVFCTKLDQHLPNAVSAIQEISPNVSQTETFAGGKTVGKLADLFNGQK